MTSELYRAHSRRVFGFIAKLTQNFEAAEDLMQDVFFQFHKYYSSKNLSAESGAMMLTTIARNVSINYLKKHSTRLESPKSDIHVQSRYASTERKMMLDTMEESLMQGLQSLESKEREAFLLKLEGMKLNELSECMDISIATASRLITKATAKLLEFAKVNNISLEE